MEGVPTIVEKALNVPVTLIMSGGAVTLPLTALSTCVAPVLVNEIVPEGDPMLVPVKRTCTIPLKDDARDSVVVQGAAFVVEYSNSATADISIVDVKFDPVTATDCDADGVPTIVENALKVPVTLITGVRGLTTPVTALSTWVAPALVNEMVPEGDPTLAPVKRTYTLPL
jgi:hypothetical protein